MAEFNRVQPFLFLTIFNVNYFLYINKNCIFAIRINILYIVNDGQINIVAGIHLSI